MENRNFTNWQDGICISENGKRSILTLISHSWRHWHALSHQGFASYRWETQVGVDWLSKGGKQRNRNRKKESFLWDLWHDETKVSSSLTLKNPISVDVTIIQDYNHSTTAVSILWNFANCSMHETFQQGKKKNAAEFMRDFFSVPLLFWTAERHIRIRCIQIRKLSLISANLPHFALFWILIPLLDPRWSGSCFQSLPSLKRWLLCIQSPRFQSLPPEIQPEIKSNLEKWGIFVFRPKRLKIQNQVILHEEISKWNWPKLFELT